MGKSRAESSELNVIASKAIPQESYLYLQEYVGQVEPRQESSIGFEREGKVTSILVDEGDLVVEGSLLATLDIKRLEVQIKEVEASIQQSRANVSLAKNTFLRRKKAKEDGAVSIQAFDEAQKNFKALEFALASLEARLESLEIEKEKSQILAPYDAIVSNRYADEAEVVAAGTPLLKLIENNKPEIRIGLSAEDAEDLHIGKKYFLKIENKEVAAELRAVLPSRNSKTRTISALFLLDSNMSAFKQGDLAILPINKRVEKAGFWLPITAITESVRGLWACYVVKKDGGSDVRRIERRELEILHQTAEKVYVRGTLLSGELVVTEGIHKLVPGLAVVPTTTPSSDLSGAIL